MRDIVDLNEHGTLENVIAEAGCGFAVSVVTFNDTHPGVASSSFAGLAEGARLASQELWN